MGKQSQIIISRVVSGRLDLGLYLRLGDFEDCDDPYPFIIDPLPLILNAERCTLHTEPSTLNPEP